MIREKIDNIEILKFGSFKDIKGIDHCFTTRLGGCSENEYRSLNMGFNTGDSKENVLENYEAVSKGVFDLGIENLVLSDQVHKTDIAIVEKSDRGRGIIDGFKYDGIDGLITDKPGLILSTVYADCTPLFFVDRKKNVVGLAHAGWRGTIGEIGKSMIGKFLEEYKSDIGDIYVGIGPSIGPCCYNVGEEVSDRFKEKFKDQSIVTYRGEKIYLDLWKANKNSLLEAGVLEENIDLSNICTHCSPEILYSYRRDNGLTGRMAAMIKII